jgi:tellurite resistance protein TehA-like permease
LEALSRVLLVVGAVAWIALGLLLAARTLRDRDRVESEARSPAALTGVAATAFLGTRLTLLGSTTAGIVLLVVALGLWLVLVRSVLAHWVTPTVGASLMLVVSTESLAALAAVLAVHERANWLLTAAIAPFLLGLVFYAFVMARFDLHQLSSGQGDHWITAGALAISAVAAARITLGASHLHSLTAVTGALKAVSLALWVLIACWLPILVVAETVRPRLQYNVRRWSTVFPVGMHAACSFGVGAAVSAGAITTFGRVWVWVALAVWLVVFVAMVRCGVALVQDSFIAATSSQ